MRHHDRCVRIVDALSQVCTAAALSRRRIAGAYRSIFRQSGAVDRRVKTRHYARIWNLASYFIEAINSCGSFVLVSLLLKMHYVFAHCYSTVYSYTKEKHCLPLMTLRFSDRRPTHVVMIAFAHASNACHIRTSRVSWQHIRYCYFAVHKAQMCVGKSET